MNRWTSHALATLCALLACNLALAALLVVSVVTREMTPQQRINEAFEAAASRPLTPYSTHNKGDLIPTPIKIITCTKQWCDPHPKGTDHIKPFEGNK